VPTPEELAQTIADAISKPAEAEQDGTRAKAHSLKDQIEAAKFAAANAAPRRLKIKFVKMIPPGATGESS